MKDSDKANIAISGILFVCILVGYLVLIPRVNIYRDSRISIENSKLKKENLETKATLLNNLGEKIKNETSFINATKDVLPVEPQVPELLLMLDKLALYNSLYINAFTPVIGQETQGQGTPGEVAVPWKIVHLQFSIVGKYPNIISFIKDLEQNIRPVDIVSISISEGGDLRDAVDKTLRFNIVAKAYYQE